MLTLNMMICLTVSGVVGDEKIVHFSDDHRRKGKDDLRHLVLHLDYTTRKVVVRNVGFLMNSGGSSQKISRV
jgi:hypothetical protein